MCDSCQKNHPRVLIYDPNMAQYFNERGELVHYSAGVLLFNKNNEILLFLRKKFPYLYTIPAGHLAKGENPQIAAYRETEEEVHIKPENLKLIFEGEVIGDACLGGADIHYWHLYVANTSQENIQLDEEGSHWQWYPLSAIPKELTYPVKFFLSNENILSKISSINTSVS